MSFFWGVTVNFVEAHIANDSVNVMCIIQGLEARQTSIEEYGIIYSENPDFSQASTYNIPQPRSFDGPFSCPLPNLKFNITYYVKPYLKIQGAEYYGVSASFRVGGGWQQVSPLPSPLSRACIVYTGQKVWLGSGTPLPIDGGFQNNYDANFWEFQPDAASSWLPFTEFPDPSTKRISTSAFYLFDKLYVGCGYNFTPGFVGSISTFFVYDPSTNTWQFEDDFPQTTRAEAVSFVINGKAYVGTGIRIIDQNNREYFNNFFEFDPNRPPDMRWRPVAPLPATASRRTSATAFTVQGKAYLLGGANGVFEVSDNWVFTPPANDSEQGSWAPLTGFPGKARKYASGFVIGDKAYYGLGETAGDGALKDFWEFNPADNSWRPVTPFQGKPRARAAAVGIGDRGLVAGGDGRRIVNNNFFEPKTYSDCWIYIPDQPQ
ncbi:MAG: hypothetical protein IPN33_18540 [Saprospiraceae bacterium]|nr:hypothetical protein [Saprospiraceae bacterium]